MSLLCVECVCCMCVCGVHVLCVLYVCCVCSVSCCGCECEQGREYIKLLQQPAVTVTVTCLYSCHSTLPSGTTHTDTASSSLSTITWQVYFPKLVAETVRFTLDTPPCDTLHGSWILVNPSNQDSSWGQAISARTVLFACNSSH